MTRRSVAPGSTGRWSSVRTGTGSRTVSTKPSFGSFLESALRNPGAADGQQGRLFIGFAAAELLGLLSFVVAMILIFVA